MNTLDEMAEVIAAAKDGKAIEMRYGPNCGHWYECADSQFNFSLLEYRIKPDAPKEARKARELWMAFTPEECGNRAYIGKGNALSMCPGREVALFREVLPDDAKPNAKEIWAKLGDNDIATVAYTQRAVDAEKSFDLRDGRRCFREVVTDDAKPKYPNPAAFDQPTPHGSGVPIVDLVKSDLEARAVVGEQRYGERLKANNGRDALMDAYQEALDLAMYLRQAIEERKL